MLKVTAKGMLTNVLDLRKYIDLCLFAEVEDRQSHIWELKNEEFGFKLKCCADSRFMDKTIAIDYIDPSGEITIPMLFHTHFEYIRDEEEDGMVIQCSGERRILHWSITPSKPALTPTFDTLHAEFRGNLNLDEGFISNLVDTKMWIQSPSTMSMAMSFNRKLVYMDEIMQKDNPDDVDQFFIDMHSVLTSTSITICEYLNELMDKHADDPRCQIISPKNEYEPCKISLNPPPEE